MGCYKKHKYKTINPSDMSMQQLAKQGNKSIDGLAFKCVAVKKRRCK